MGYYTTYEFEMSLNDTPIDKSNFEEEVGTSWQDFLKTFYDTTDYDFDFSINCKWYDWKKDMINLSALYPGLLFKVDGNGEEAGDVWRWYFRNGLSQHAKMTYDEFDPAKLK